MNGLIAPGDSELDKAKKLYKAVQALDNTDFSRKKTETEMKELKLKPVKRAEDTWSQKSGSGNDIALLYLAMLRAAGLNVFAMKVVNRDDSIFDPAYLDADQLDDIIVIISIAGKEILLDPGQKMCPFQTVHWKHEGAAGIRQSPGGSAAAGSPPGLYTVNPLQRAGDLILDGHGAVTGVLNLAMTGQRALRWRQAALRNDEDEVKKQFDHWLESMVPDGVEAHIDSFTGLDNPDIPLIASVKANGNLGAATSKRLLLPAFFFETRGAHPFVDQAKRLEPVDMQFGEVVTDQIVYHLPTGFAVEGAPQDSKIPWVGYAVLVTKSKTDPGQITIGRLLSRAFTLVKPEQYQDLRGFYQKVAAADQAQLVLTVKDAASVILYDEYLETFDAQGRAVEREREVRRILKPQGRGDAFCLVPFDVDEKINYFREWTIAADQKQYQAQDTDFVDVGDPGHSTMLSTQKVRGVNPPAADVGATIICESEKLIAPYRQEKVWHIQDDVPVVFQALEVDLSAGRAHTEAWHKFPPVKPVEVAPNHWRWEIKDMPALNLRDVKSRPVWEALAARMSVMWGDAAVDGKDKRPTSTPSSAASPSTSRRTSATLSSSVALEATNPTMPPTSSAIATATAKTKPPCSSPCFRWPESTPTICPWMIAAMSSIPMFHPFTATT